MWKKNPAMIEMTLKVKSFSQDFSFSNSAKNAHLVLCLMSAAQSGGIWAGSWRLKCLYKTKCRGILYEKHQTSNYEYKSTKHKRTDRAEKRFAPVSACWVVEDLSAIISSFLQLLPF